MRTEPSSTATPPEPAPWPENPVLTQVWRGGHVESQHRGAWVLVDTAGSVLDGAGDAEQPIFARSSLKSLQALPLVESGAADRFELGEEGLALALASHNAEPCHTACVERVLARLGLSPDDLRCGPQPPGDADTRRALARDGRPPGRVHNNCSGKHAGFLALTRHLGADPRGYLDPDGPTQRAVRAAVAEMTGLAPESLYGGIDGCSAPTFRMPLSRLATAIARVANPEGLAPERRAACERMQRAVARHPHLIAGNRRRLCTDLARAGGGTLFPKLGGEAVYVIGAVGRDRALAIKVDDGSARGFQALALELCRRLGWLDAGQLEALAAWRAGPLTNWAGEPVGRVEVVA
ncbi:MAG TPA: asparaginase [Planctomycetota bacterium]|nr:asparaginase [Planctomycetota bacterium]